MQSNLFRLTRSIVASAVVLLTLLTGCRGLQAQQHTGDNGRAPVTRAVTPTLLAVSVTPPLISPVDAPQAGQNSTTKSQFIVRVSGNLKTEFTGSCSYETVNPLGNRIEAIDIVGRIDVHQAAYEFPVPGRELSCSITNTTPNTAMMVELCKDGVVVKQVQTSASTPQVYIDYSMTN